MTGSETRNGKPYLPPVVGKLLGWGWRPKRNKWHLSASSGCLNLPSLEARLWISSATVVEDHIISLSEPFCPRLPLQERGWPQTKGVSNYK